MDPVCTAVVGSVVFLANNHIRRLDENRNPDCPSFECLSLSVEACQICKIFVRPIVEKTSYTGLEDEVLWLLSEPKSIICKTCLVDRWKPGKFCTCSVDRQNQPENAKSEKLVWATLVFRCSFRYRRGLSWNWITIVRYKSWVDGKQRQINKPPCFVWLLVSELVCRPNQYAAWWSKIRKLWLERRFENRAQRCATTFFCIETFWSCTRLAIRWSQTVTANLFGKARPLHWVS